jgi:hypothetical protein
VRIDNQLGVVGATIEHPPRTGRLDGRRDLEGEARGLVVTESVTFDMSCAQPDRERAGKGGLAAAGAADDDDPLRDRCSRCGTGCHLRTVRRWGRYCQDRLPWLVVRSSSGVSLELLVVVVVVAVA